MKRRNRIIILFTIAITVLFSCSIIVQAAVKVGAPKITKVKQTGQKEVTVKWQKVSGANGYELDYRLSGKKWNTAAAKKNEYVLTGLKVNKTYQFRVRAYKGKSSKTTFSNLTYGNYSTIKKLKVSKMAVSNSYRNYYIRPGLYCIKNAFFSDRCLDVKAWGLQNGGNIETYHNNRTTNQIFDVSYDSASGSYSFKSILSDKYLHWAGGSSNNVHLWEGNKHSNARWILSKAGNGYYYIRNLGAYWNSNNYYLTTDTYQSSANNVYLGRRLGNSCKWYFASVNRKPYFTFTRDMDLDISGNTLELSNIRVSSDYPITKMTIYIYKYGGVIKRVGSVDYSKALDINDCINAHSFSWNVNMYGWSRGKYYVQIKCETLAGDTCSYICRYFEKR